MGYEKDSNTSSTCRYFAAPAISTVGYRTASLAVSDKAHEFLARHVSLLDKNTLTAQVGQVGRVLWRVAPSQLAEMMEDGGVLSHCRSNAFANISPRELVAGVEREPALMKLLLANRPDVMGDIGFWASPTIEFGQAIVALTSRNSDDLSSAALCAMMASKTPNLLSYAVRAFGANTVLKAIKNEFGKTTWPSSDSRLWLDPSTLGADVIARFLTNETSIPKVMLLALAEQMSPNSLPSKVDADPWLVAFNRAEGSLDEGDANFLYSFLLTRAFGSKTRHAAELICCSFDHVYSASRSNLLGNSAWSMINEVLPRRYYFSINREPPVSLVIGVANLFVDRELSGDIFLNCTANDQLFSQLANQVERSSGGRRYIKKVRLPLLR